jgi:hypothetical protein
VDAGATATDAAVVRAAAMVISPSWLAKADGSDEGTVMMLLRLVPDGGSPSADSAGASTVPTRAVRGVLPCSPTPRPG